MVTTPSRQMLQLRVTLLNVEPAIWRELLVPDDLTFAKLHDILQAAMGWEDCHMHEFEVGGAQIGNASPNPLDFDGEGPRDERKTRLSDALEWVGDFDPARFDLAKAAKAVAKAGGRTRARK